MVAGLQRWMVIWGRQCGKTELSRRAAVEVVIARAHRFPLVLANENTLQVSTPQLLLQAPSDCA